MSEFQYKAGINNVGNYQVSGVPYVTGALTVPTGSGTPLEISFPSVTKYFEIINQGSVDIKIGFSSNGIKGTNCYVVAHAQNNQQNMPQRFDLKCTKIYLLSTGAANSSVYVCAGLTNITGYDLATAYSGSVGIG